MANLHGEGEHEFEADVSVFFLLFIVTGIPVIRKNYINQRETKSRKENVVFVLAHFRGGQLHCIVDSPLHSHTEETSSIGTHIQ